MPRLRSILCSLVFLWVLSALVVSTGTASAQTRDSEANVALLATNAVIHLPNTNAEIMLLIGSNIHDHKAVELREVRGAIPTYRSVSLWQGKALLKEMSVGNVTRQDIEDAFDERWATRPPYAGLRRELHTEKLHLNLASFGAALQSDAVYPVQVEAVLTVNGEPLTVRTTANVTILPAVVSDDNWYPGDGHIHSTWSDAGGEASYAISTLDRVNSARDNGFSWIILSDHTQQLDGRMGHDILLDATGIYGNQNESAADEYQRYTDELNNYNTFYPSLTVIGGLEYSTRDPNYTSQELRFLVDTLGVLNDLLFPVKDAHLLVYNMSVLPAGQFLEDPLHTDYPIVPDGVHRFDIDNFTGQYLLDQVKQRGAFAVIAHPFNGSYPWFHDSPTPGWDDIEWGKDPLGIELMSGGELKSLLFPLPPDERLVGIENNEGKWDKIGKWDEFLAQGRQMFGMANSDAHDWLGNHFGQYWTYLNIPAGTPRTQQTVLKAIREGRTIASTGPFLNVTVGHYGIGDTVEASKGQILTVTLTWKYTKLPFRIKIACKTGSQTTIKSYTASEFNFAQINGVYVGSKTIQLTVQGDGYLRAWGTNARLVWTLTAALLTPVRSISVRLPRRSEQPSSGIRHIPTLTYISSVPEEI